MTTESPPKRVVRVVQRPAAEPTREYAPARFAGQRNQQLDAAESDIAETADGPTLAADKAQGTPIVIESGVVHGGGTARRSQKPAQRMAPPPKGATWMGGLGSSSGVQNQVLPDRASPGQAVGELVDPEAVPQDEQIVRPHVGPADPTGEPCSCAWVWEIEPETGDTVVRPGQGISTTFRGAPKWVRHCIICGGMRDGSFDSEYAARYGPMESELASEPADANSITEQVMERLAAGRQAPVDAEALAAQVTNTVMESMATYMASDQFATLIASKIAAQRPTRRARKEA